MKNKQIILSSLMILLLTSTVQSMQTFALHHMPEPKHQMNQQHTSSYYVYHNMKNIHLKQHNHALHLSSVSETYGINSMMAYFFSLNMTVEGMPYSLNIDTGSSDIFIKGQNSKGKPDVKYTCPVCKRQNPHMAISYLDGTLLTYLKEATINLGKHTFKENILVAYEAPKNFENPQGLVGLSFPQLATNPHPTFLQTLINNKIISKYAFGLNLNFQNNKTSSINFGQPDPQKFEGQLKKVPLLHGFSYRISLDSVQVGQSTRFKLPSALLDSGNSCISLPKKCQKQILQQFNKGPNSCAFCKEPFAPMFSLLRCRVKDFSLLPTVKIFIDGTKLQIDKDAYTQRCVQEGDDSLCDFYIEVMSASFSVIIGDTFFNRYYTYFDIQNKQIGVAKNKEVLSYKNMYKPATELDDQDMAFFKMLKEKRSL